LESCKDRRAKAPVERTHFHLRKKHCREIHKKQKFRGEKKKRSHGGRKGPQLTGSAMKSNKKIKDHLGEASRFRDNTSKRGNGGFINACSSNLLCVRIKKLQKAATKKMARKGVPGD